MKIASQVVFRRITDAEFFNINKPPGTETRGGGQSYIDFPLSSIKAADWVSFFAGQKKLKTDSGPFWMSLSS